MPQQERPRVWSYLTRSRFLHVEDALDVGAGKLRLYAGAYIQGQGAKGTAFHFVDVDAARVVFSDLAWGKSVDFADFKGTASQDGPQSRVLKIKTKGAKVWLQIQNGPGQVVGQGAVKPAGKPDAEVSVPLPAYEARKLGFAVLDYLQAWEVARRLQAAGDG